MIPLDRKFTVNRYTFLFTEEELTISSTDRLWSTTVSKHTFLYKLVSKVKFRDSEPADEDERKVLTVMCDNMYMTAILPGDAILMRERIDSIEAYYDRIGKKGGKL